MGDWLPRRGPRCSYAFQMTDVMRCHDIQVFEMLVGRWLFHPEDGTPDFSLEDDHLAKMMEFTGERFSAEMLGQARNRDKYFDRNGMLHTFIVPVHL